MKQLSALLKSFRYAGRGVVWAIKQERNLRIHLCAVCYVILFGIWQKLSVTHWVIQIGCCALVIALELINTALEVACDLFCSQKSAAIANAKDLGAGAVLAASIGSAVIWLVTLIGKAEYLSNMKEAFSSLPAWLILCAWALCSTLFVFLLRYSKETKDINL